MAGRSIATLALALLVLGGPAGAVTAGATATGVTATGAATTSGAPPVAPSPARAPAAPAGEAAAREMRDVAFVDALTWGATPSAMAAFHALGREAWLKGQLHPAPAPPGAAQRQVSPPPEAAQQQVSPPPGAAQQQVSPPPGAAQGQVSPPPEAAQQHLSALPEAAQRQIDALAISHTSAFDRAVAFRARELAMQPVTDPEEKAALQKAFQADMSDAARQAAAASILRALYGPDQLRGRMTWFWLNHFSVHQAKGNLRLLVGDYEDTAIRPHALGRFRDLLEATLKHPAMLRYLDNADNAANRINENYAREIMELHTLGVGSGYSQADVEALARILTGAGISTQPDAPKLKPEWQPLLVRDGLFEFNPARHDFTDKVFLGHAIAGRGFAEVEEALDILSRAPATARHVSRQIATYFVADDPPEALVARMAARFQASDGDIAAVLDTMIRAPEFEAALGTRFKDPVRYVLSAVRLAYDDKVISNTQPVQNWLNRLGEGLYGHQTPDGYPLASAAWTASGQMTTRFEIARQIGSTSAGLFKPADGEGAERPAFPLLQNSLYFSSLRLRLSAPTRLALEEATSPQDWNTLFLSSPEFMR